MAHLCTNSSLFTDVKAARDAVIDEWERFPPKARKWALNRGDEAILDSASQFIRRDCEIEVLNLEAHNGRSKERRKEYLLLLKCSDVQAYCDLLGEKKALAHLAWDYNRNYVNLVKCNETDLIVPLKSSLSPTDADAETPDSTNIADSRKQISRTILERRGQQQFRDKLLSAYKSTCAITQCTLVFLLKAAHIIPYCRDQTNDVTNGILLRADLHTLFDLGYLKIDPGSYKISICEELLNSEYALYNDSYLNLPDDRNKYPDHARLKQRFS